MTNLIDMNRFLFCEFDLDLEGESISDVSDNWPFTLKKSASFTHHNQDVTVYTFDDFGEHYNLIDGHNLSYSAQLDFDTESLRLELIGSYYINSQEFALLDSYKSSDSEGPTRDVKEKDILSLAKKHTKKKEQPYIIEALYFLDTQEYIALIKYAKEEGPRIIGTDFLSEQIGYDSAPALRRICVSLGLLIDQGKVVQQP